MLQTTCTLRAKPPWRVMFLGTDQYALTVLKALVNDLLQRSPGKSNIGGVIEKLDVVTKPSKCVVNYFARENNSLLRHHTWPDVDIKPGDFDVGIIASFGKIIPKDFIEFFPYGILNIHPSLLPRWRGAAPIPYTILAGDKITGITIQQIQPRRIDIGPIVNRREVTVPVNSTTKSLTELLAKEGAQLMLETLKDLKHLEDMKIDQDDRLATYAYKIQSDDPNLLIDWRNESCRAIDRKFRALSDLHDIKSYFGNQRVKLRNAVPVEDLWMYTLKDRYLASRPGSGAYIKKINCLCIQSKDGLVGIREIVMKKPMTAFEFHNGYLSKVRWKYTQFSHEPSHDVMLAPPNVLTTETVLQQQKYWQMQLIRMSFPPSTS